MCTWGPEGRLKHQVSSKRALYSGRLRRAAGISLWQGYLPVVFPRQVADVPLLAGDLPLMQRHRTTPVLLQEWTAVSTSFTAALDDGKCVIDLVKLADSAL